MLPWDTEFFGCRVARTTIERLDESSMVAIDAWCSDHKVDCLYTLVKGDNFAGVHAVENAGFHLMGLRVEMQHGNIRQSTDAPLKSAAIVREANAGDVPELKNMTTGIYRQSRFYTDPGFSDKRCTDLFNTWIQKSCDGYADKALVAEQDDQLLGYITLNLSKDSRTTASIGLLGVRQENRRQGTGTLLLSHALQWAAERNIESLSVVTQSQNAGAIKIYENIGFSIASIDFWYHWWIRYNG